MKLKIASLLILGISSVLVGCIGEDTVATTSTDSSAVSIQGLAIADSTVSTQNVTITGADGSVIFKGTTDRLGAFSANAPYQTKLFPLHVTIGDSANGVLRGDISLSDLTRDHKVACTFKKEGVQKGAFDPRFAPRDPMREIARECNLPKPDSANREIIRSYLEKGQQVPDSLLPKLTAEQQACVDAKRPPLNPGQALAKKCNLPKPDSATELQIRAYIEKHQPIPADLLPKLTAEQQACVDANRGPINPTGFGPIGPMHPNDSVAIKCNLPELTAEQKAAIEPYVSKGQIVPRELLPVLTTEQQACVDSLRPPKTGPVAPL